MANVLVWYHGGARMDQHGWPIPVIGEPSLMANDEAETVVTPGATSTAPNMTIIAHIETDARVRYRVRNAGATTSTAGPLNKYIDVPNGQIALTEGQSIHFIEG